MYVSPGLYYNLHVQLLLPSQRGIIILKHLFEIEEGLNLLLLKSRPRGHIVEVGSPCRSHNYQLFKNLRAQARPAVYHNLFAARK